MPPSRIGCGKHVETGWLRVVMMSCFQVGGGHEHAVGCGDELCICRGGW